MPVDRTPNWPPPSTGQIAQRRDEPFPLPRRDVDASVRALGDAVERGRTVNAGTPSLAETTKQHVTNNSQFVRQRDLLTELPDGLSGGSNDYWDYGTTVDNYQHIVGETPRYRYGGWDEEDDPEVVMTPASNANLQVKHRGARGSTQYRPEGDDYQASNFDYRARRLAEFSGEIPGQQAFFIHESSKPTSTVEYMMSTKGGRVANMTQLGMAARDTLLRHGRELRPSDDLSPHSTRLVNKLEEKGVTKNRKALSNSLGFEPKPFPAEPLQGFGADGQSNRLSRGQFEPVPDADVEGGRRMIRSVLGGKKRSEGEQLMMEFR